MIGTTLKKLLDEREIKVNEFARQIQVPAQTLYSIIRRDNMKIDFELLLRICDALHVPLETFLRHRQHGPADARGVGDALEAAPSG